MALKKKSKKTSSKPSNDGLVTGLGIDDLKKQLASGGGGGNVDPEMIFLYDGDIIKVVFVAPIKKWVTYKQHYVGKSGKGGGYRICQGEGCQYCDDGLYASQRTMIGVYVMEHYQAKRKDFPAKVTKKVGYRYIVTSKDTTDTLLARAARRNGRLDDSLYIIERRGDDTNTKYDVERTGDKPNSKILSGWSEMDILEKVRGLRRKEQDMAAPEDDDDDEDFDYESDFDEDEDDLPRKKKSKSSTKKSSSKKSSRRRR